MYFRNYEPPRPSSHDTVDAIRVYDATDCTSSTRYSERDQEKIDQDSSKHTGRPAHSFHDGKRSGYQEGHRRGCHERCARDQREWHGAEQNRSYKLEDNRSSDEHFSEEDRETGPRYHAPHLVAQQMTTPTLHQMNTSTSMKRDFCSK